MLLRSVLPLRTRKDKKKIIEGTKSYQGSKEGQGQGPGKEGKAEVDYASSLQLRWAVATLGASLVKTHEKYGKSKALHKVYQEKISENTHRTNLLEKT